MFYFLQMVILIPVERFIVPGYSVDIHEFHIIVESERWRTSQRK